MSTSPTGGRLGITGDSITVSGDGTASVAGAGTASVVGAGTASVAGAGTASVAGAGTASVAGAGTASVAGAGTASVAGVSAAGAVGVAWFKNGEHSTVAQLGSEFITPLANLVAQQATPTYINSSYLRPIGPMTTTHNHPPRVLMDRIHTHRGSPTISHKYTYNCLVRW